MVSKLDTKGVIADFSGKPKLELAPIAKPAGDLPDTWKRALAAADPIGAVFDEVWKPAHKLLPKTIALFRKTTQAIGVVTAKKEPPSLVYFSTGDGNTYGRRGYPARAIPAKVARGVHADFLKLYEVHDGWLDQWQQMGWMRHEDWHPLGTEGPSADFLVTFEGHGPGRMGFDLQESPPTCWTIWNADPPDRIKNIGKEIDDWMMAQYEDLDVRPQAPKVKPAGAAKVKPSPPKVKPGGR